MDNQMGMFDPMAQSPLSNNPPSVQQQPHHPQAHQQPQQNMVPQQPNHYNSNMSNNQHIKTEHNPVGAWQRGGWDSGIHSGATSQTPSVMSGHSDLSAIMSEFSEHNPNFQNTNPQGQPNAPIAGSAGPEALMKMQQMFNYQDEEGFATAMPMLVNYMKDPDTVIIRNASQVLHNFSKRDLAKNMIAQHREIIPTLISALSLTNDPDTARASTGALHNVSQMKPGRDMIYHSNGIPALVKVLACSVDAVVFYAITTVHNLLLHIKQSKAAVRDTQGAIDQMVALLQKKDNVKFLAICTDCLHLLGYGDQSSKVQMIHAGAAVQLVNILNQHQYEKLLWTTSRVLKVLSSTKESKMGMLQAGGFQALGNHLGSSSQRLVTNCLWTMRNLSDAATSLPDLTNIIRKLIEKLSSEDFQTVSITSGILANLTCNNQKNKNDCINFNGIEVLIRAIVNASDRQDVSEPAVCALRHITARREQADLANQKVREAAGNQGLSIIMKYLMPGQAKYALRKAVLGLVKNLTMNRDNRSYLVHHLDLINVLSSLLQSLVQPFTQNGQGDRESHSLIDASCNVLKIVASDPEGCHRIFQNQRTLNILIEMLRSTHLQNSSGTLLGQMCTFDNTIVEHMRGVGCLQLIEQIHQANMQRQKQQEQRHRQLQQQQWEQQQQQQQQQMNPGWNPQMAYDAQGHPPGQGGHPQNHVPSGHPGQPHQAYQNTQMPNGAPFDPAYVQPGMGHPQIHPGAPGHQEQYHPSQPQQSGGHHAHQTPPNNVPGEVHGQMPMSNWFEPM